MMLVWKIAKKTISEWSEDNVTRLAAAVAFYSILSLAPLLVIAVSIASFIFGEEAARMELINQVRTLVGESGAEVVATTLDRSRLEKSGLFATLVGVITLLVGASGVFGELQDAMDSIWDVRTKRGSSWWRMIRSRLLSFGMVLTVGFLLLVSLVVSTVLTVINGYAERWISQIPAFLPVVGSISNFAMITLLFALIFRYLPHVRTSWRFVWIGAFVTAVLFTFGKYLISLYLSTAAVGSPFGAAGSFVALIIWIYYSAIIVFLGAELTQVIADVCGEKPPPTEEAEWAPAKPSRMAPSPSRPPH